MRFLSDVRVLFLYPVPHKFHILWTYFKISLCLYFSISKTSLYFLKRKIHFSSLLTLQVTFREIFILNEYYTRIKKTNPKIIDCGANIGLASLYYLMLYPEAAIDAYEPHPDIFFYLKKNVGERVRCVNKAVSDKEGEITLYSRGDLGGTSTTKKEIASKKSTPINVVTTVLPQNMHIDLIKIDVEGGEWDIISSLNLQCVNEIIFEYHSIIYKLKEIIDYLGDLEILSSNGAISVRIGRNRYHAILRWVNKYNQEK